jgi:hypothetical protein
MFLSGINGVTSHKAELLKGKSDRKRPLGEPGNV